MTDGKVDFETLNAFVDNELDAGRRAEILARAARDLALARELAALSRLKATLAESVETPEPRQLLPPARAPRHRGRRMAVAACLTLLLAVGAFLAIALFGGETARNSGWIVAAHDGWAKGPDVPGSNRRALAAAAITDVYLPDLSSARLALSHVGQVPGPHGGRATVVGYVGTRGCKVSLIVFPAREDGVTALARIDLAPLLAFGWRTGGRDFVVAASGMAEERLSLIAAGLREASTRQLPIGEETRTALAASRAASPPCRA